MDKIKESDLYLPIKAFFIGNGYSVNGEVSNVDIVISKDDDLIAIEMKTSFNLKLLHQAVDRQKIFDSVYVAIPKPKQSFKNRRYNEIIHLLKRLEVGLITVTFLKSGPIVKVEHHPIEFMKKRNNKKRNSIINEINNRSGVIDNIGGTTRTKNMTAYKERSLYLACLLGHFGESSPKFLKTFGADTSSSNIMNSNFYGWFERIDRGVYRLSSGGYAAIQEYNEISQFFINNIKILIKEKES